MTDDTDLQSLERAKAKLRDTLDKLTDKLSPSGDDPPEKTARAISAIIKSMDDIDAKCAHIRQDEQDRKYTNWEDLPPPSPEEDARFYEEFKRLYNSILDERGAGEALSPDDASAANAIYDVVEETQPCRPKSP